MKKLLILLFTSLLILGACGKNVETNDIIKSFEKEGLSVEDNRDMKKEDFGLAPNKTKDAKIFTVTSDKNGRLFVFDNESDLKDTKKYYKKLGEGSAMLSSHIYSNDKVLLQMNSDIDEDTFKKFTKVIDKVLDEN
ncbi:MULTISPECIES: hypothetical protein [unclassified Mammaliicoccus]|uniref:hypothetical protein n=1 Tax=unclassified Mammaliicoccus TaxID=2803851 RepID=UPI001EFBA26E|nr:MULTISPECIES: hypothetical protein [unclassified Mammaliicoccus]